MGVESYKHQFAKATLAGWLRELARQQRLQQQAQGKYSGRLPRSTRWVGRSIGMSHTLAYGSNTRCASIRTTRSSG